MLSGEMRRAASTRDWQVLVRPCARARVCEFARAILALAHGAGVAHERLPRLGLADVAAQCGLDGLVHIHSVLEGGEREDRVVQRLELHRTTALLTLGCIGELSVRWSVANALRTESVWLWFAKIVSIATISFAINAAAVSASIVLGVLENSCN